MPPTLAALFVFAHAAVAPAACDAGSGWDDGRQGRATRPACAAEDYREGHRLGLALHQLRGERDAIERRLAALAPAERAAQARRQRQIDTDLEAIRGLATIKGWPLDIDPELRQ